LSLISESILKTTPECCELNGYGRARVSTAADGRKPVVVRSRGVARGLLGRQDFRLGTVGSMGIKGARPIDAPEKVSIVTKVTTGSGPVRS
jgi:hypothetical protein